MGRSKRVQQAGGSLFSPTLVLWVMLMLSNNLVLPVFSTRNTNFADQKNYYSSPNPPSGVDSSPSHHGSSSGGVTIHPGHGSSSHHSSPSGGAQSNCGTPPSHHSGGGGYYPGPTPKPTPSSPHTPSPSHGGGGCSCASPPPPKSGGGGSGGGGGYYRPPPTTPVTPSPLVPSPPYVTPVTPSPLVPSPPPLVPVTPTPSSPPFDPHGPFPCTYWGSHPGAVFGLIGWWATIGGLWGVGSLPTLNTADYSIQDILNSPRRDGYGSLYREGTASFLNSLAAAKHFPFSTKHVKDAFLNSLSSDKAAAAQARVFKLANEGRLKHLIH